MHVPERIHDRVLFQLGRLFHQHLPTTKSGRQIWRSKRLRPIHGQMGHNSQSKEDKFIYLANHQIYIFSSLFVVHQKKKYQEWMTNMNEFQQKLFFWFFIFSGFYLFFRGLINYTTLKYRPALNAEYQRRNRNRFLWFVE